MRFFGQLCGLTGAFWTALLAGQVAVADIGLTNINDPGGCSAAHTALVKNPPWLTVVLATSM